MAEAGTGLTWMGRVDALIWHFIRTSVDDDDDDGETKGDDEDWLCSPSDGLYTPNLVQKKVSLFSSAARFVLSLLFLYFAFVFPPSLSDVSKAFFPSFPRTFSRLFFASSPVESVMSANTFVPYSRSLASPDTSASRSSGEYLPGPQDGWNSSNMLNRPQFNPPAFFSPTNHHHHLPSSPPLLPDPASNGFSFNDREPKLLRLPSQSNPTLIGQQSLSSLHHSLTSLRWTELEPWMDEEYTKQVCTMRNWDPVTIKVPRPPPDPVTGQQANNPGYCFLTFNSQAQAASVLGEITNSPTPVIMPNSTKPFVFNWASSVPASPPTSSLPMTTQAQQSTHHQQPPNFTKEYSIFVGDLAPEVSNSDLVAVFRNPVLGLRNDREPRFIRPFLSCKSAKIMLDPVTGVSRGYGFVR